MKNLIIFFVLLLSNIAFSQTNNLPIVVDNSAFFPPARTQQNVPDCSYFSMIYYLKSYEWNRHFNRNPKLEENQFSHSFAWNQNINPVYQMSDPTSAFNFMKNQGCATVADFPLTETSTDVQPSVEVKTKALAYKSKRLFTSDFMTNWPSNIDQQFSPRSKDMTRGRIESLKDSLANGKCFSFSFRIYDSLMKLSNKNRVFSYYPGTSVDSIRPGHISTVIGYNDTIRTATGRGAFMVLDSDTSKISNGIFYFDYQWFYSEVWWFPYYFLEEDFSSPKPEVVMNISLTGAIKTDDICNGRYLFTDTVITYEGKNITYEGKKIDFKNDGLDYLYYRNQVQVVSINKSRINLRSNLIFFPANSSDGNYDLVTDLSSIDNLKSLSVIVFDPISAKYIGENNEVIYTYNREVNCQINEAGINLISLGKKVVGKIINLPDTIITVNNFESYPSLYHISGPHTYEYVHVKSCTSVLKRKMITFTLEEETAPVFVDPPSTLTTVINQTLSYTFIAKDKDNRPITYYLENTSPEASLTSNGELTFKSAKIGTYKYTVVASNSKAITTLPLTVKVDFSDAVEDIEVPEVSVKVFPNPIVNNVSVKFLLTKEETVKTVIYDYIGRLIKVIDYQTYYAGENIIDYDATNLMSGVYIVKFEAGSFSKSIKVVKQ